MAGRDIKKEKEKIRQLLAKGKEKGMLSYEEIMDSLSSTELSPEQIDDVYEQISAMGIKLVHAESEKISLIWMKKKWKLYCWRQMMVRWMLF